MNYDAEIENLRRENAQLRGACVYPGNNRVDDFLKLHRKLTTARELIERSRDALPGHLVGLRASLEAFLKENREEGS